MGKRDNQEVFPKPKEERRLLTHVKDPTARRTTIDRRGKILKDNEDENKIYELGLRYKVDFDVEIHCKDEKGVKAKAIDISTTGMLLKINLSEYKNIKKENILLKFNIPEGTMKEGYDHKVNIKATIVREIDDNEEDEFILVGFNFEKSLYDYFRKKRWISEITISSILLGVISLLIILMRVDSIIYFRYEPLLYGYSILTAVYLLSRYLFGGMYKAVPINEDYTPGVSIVIPCFNEEKWIHKTIISCLNQDYPIDKIEVIVVDDCSNDNSVQAINNIIDKLKKEAKDYKIAERIKFIPLKENSGKRVALVRGVEVATHEFVTFVDSDSFLLPDAIKNLVQPFQDDKVGGVTGRTDVENSWTNYITKMQAVRYFVSFRMLKAAESVFDAVTCLSGPISCYRKSLIDKYKDDWLNQTFLGQPATFGDDRSMTNFLLKDNRTVYQDTAVCTTIVPSDFKVFLKQQMRWKRSWLRETMRAGSFMWKKEPFQAISFYAGFIVPILAPVIVLYNLVYVPIVYKVIPIVFILGILSMSLLMSFVYLLLRKSKIWIYGLLFCLFYEFILLWQMPIACVTFWKSTWGTRETKEDIEDELRKQEKREQKNIKKFKKGLKNI